MTAEEILRLEYSPEAVKRRAQRAFSRRGSLTVFGYRFDPLEERARLVEYWKDLANDWPGFRPPWCWAFYFNNHQRLLLPRTRAYLQQRRDLARQRMREDMARSAALWREKQAAKKAAKKAARTPASCVEDLL